MKQPSLLIPKVCVLFIALCLALSGVFTIEAYAIGVPCNSFVVNSIADDSDSDLSDDLCNTSQSECTLRAAIEQANMTNNVDADTPDEIGFDLLGPSVHTILPLSPLPNITEAVRIDGYTQGTAEANTLDVGSDALLKIEIDGSLAGALTFGLTLTSSGSTIRGLVINRFGQSNILLDGANENHIEGNYIGTDPTGTLARPNGADGIALFNSASNVFGGATPDKRNVLSGNAWSGIAMLNGPSQGNVVEGNYIGTDPSGMNAVPNGLDGVLISALIGVNTYATMNRIGGVGVGQGNLISGNGRNGVHVFRGTLNEILGNLIGTKVDGKSRLPNQNDGVLLNGASDNLVGGQFVGDGSGTIAAFKRNIISGNNERGVTIFVGSQPASGNRVVGNFIGTDITGHQPVPNTLSGVLLGAGIGATATLTGNIIGGTDGQAATRNIISGNGSSGVTLAGNMVSNNDVVGNFIGLSATGAAKLGNALDGVRFSTFSAQIAGPIGNFIGTSAPNSGNVISGNGGDGVAIAFGSTGNFVQNNIIGLDPLGITNDPDGSPDNGDEIGNTRHGVAIFDSPLNFIGFGTVETRNVISGNGGSGVFIGLGSSGGGATGNLVAGNFIGVDSDGTCFPFPFFGVGNMGDGILIEGVPDNIIGGAQAGSANVISCNARDGVHITGANATGNKLFRNLIGVESDASTDSGNRRHGVFIGNGSSGNSIGDVINNKGNLIAFNDVSGVTVESGTGNAIRGNQIFENDGLGIDLAGDGFTENDTDDVDTGANDLQNFPIVTVEIVGGRTEITIDIDSKSNTTYSVDIYSDEVSQDVFSVQGRSFLVTTDFTTGDTSPSGLVFSQPGVHHNISVTITDPNGNTSEFGREQLVHSVEFTQAIQIFQPLDELLLTLEGTGEPPVPLIAGKPGVMRIYVRELRDKTEINAEVSGLGFAFQDAVVAQPGCTPLERRRKDPAAIRKCMSVDMYFLGPPQGQWNTVLTIRTPSGDVFERHRFRQVTRTAKTLVLTAASVCHNVDASGNWICGDERRLNTLVGLLRSIAPTHKVRVELSHYIAAARLSRMDLDGDGKDVSQVGNLLEKRKWINTMKNTLTFFSRAPRILSPSPTDEIRLFYGMMMNLPNFPGGSAWIGGPAGFGAQSSPAFAAQTVAHETSHMLGRQHTNRNGGLNTNPTCTKVAPDSGTDWPFCDSTIQSNPVTCTSASGPVATKEIGFDVFKKITIDPDAAFDIMGYCSPKWISPFTYNQLAKSRLVQMSGSNLPRQGPAPASITGSFWLVAGELDNGAATFDPLLQFDTTALDTLGAGSHRIEVRDVSGVVLSTLFFEPMIADTEIDEGEVDVLNLPYFSVLIPVQIGASRIVVLDGFDTELGSIMLNGAPPTVTVNFTPGGAPLGGPLTVGWTIVDPDSAEHTVWVQYSNDNGLTWHTLSLSETEMELRIDFDRLPGADGSAIIRVLATDGVNSGFGDSTPFSVAHKLPQVEIFFPEDGTVFRRGELVWLQASVSDLDESFIDEAAITWTSSVDGALGQGEEFPTTSLGVGVHTITVTGTDSDGNMAEHSITITVEDSALVETTAVINVPADQPTIQAAIDASLSGDEIIVAPGTYDEIIDFNGKAITLRSSGGADVTIIDATNVADPGDGKPVVRCDNVESASTVLDGFTITGGTGDTGLSGAAFARGGGMFNNGSSPTVTNCTFSGNAVNFTGGGMFNFNGSSPTVTNCTFDGNSAKTGGGMDNTSTSDPIVANCTFSGNTAEQAGGGMFSNGSSPTVTNCKFNGNAADLGGGIYSVFGSLTVTNCMFTRNAALSNGGGMMNRLCSPTVTGCTFAGNTALSNGGGMHNLDSSDPAITNCIFWMNSDLGGTDESGQIHNDDTLGPNIPTVNFSNIQGGWTGLGGAGNINIDPLFMDADGPDNVAGTADDDLRLQASSPCIDSGSPSFVASPAETDLDGHTRVLCSRVDMGAYEFAGDFACDQTIDLTDFANWDACMTGPGGGPYAPGCATFDCDADLDIDMQDFAEFGIIFSP